MAEKILTPLSADAIKVLECSKAGLIVVTCDDYTWEGLLGSFARQLPPNLKHLEDCPILHLRPGEKIDSLSAEDLLCAGLKRV